CFCYSYSSVHRLRQERRAGVGRRLRRLRDGVIALVISRRRAAALPIFNLGVDLGRHAAGGREEHDLRDEVQQSREVPEVAVEHGDAVANTGQNLHEVVEPDDAVVALVRREVVHVHQQEARRRHGQPGTEAGLEAHARPRKLAFPAVARLEAQAGRQIPLAAQIILPLRARRHMIQRSVPHVPLAADERHREAAREALERRAERRVAHPQLEGLSIRRVLLVRRAAAALGAVLVGPQRLAREAKTQGVASHGWWWLREAARVDGRAALGGRVG
ncbi:unnamed protein product, partial [Pelagomonas calceolata]